MVEPSRDFLKQLAKAQDVMESARALEYEVKASKSCCGGVSLNYSRRYIIGKQIGRLTREVFQLKERLESISCQGNGPLRLPSVKVCSNKRETDREGGPHLGENPTLVPVSHSKNFIAFESREEPYGELFTALKNDDIDMIGLYGKRGCGKTFLASEICRAAMHSKLYDVVIFYTLSTNYTSVSLIQDKIAHSLGLILDEDKRHRAATLSERLNNGDKFLIVLDDIVEELNLEDIGIPPGKNSKVILIASGLRALVGCQKVTSLSPLTQEEAGMLFQGHVGTIEDEVLAQEIVKKCQGSPLSITIVAESLKGSSADRWKEASGGYNDRAMVDKCVRLSIAKLRYDASSLFVLCAFFPENSNITLELLIRCAFASGIFENVQSYERTRSKVGAVIDELLNSCLLLLAEEGQYFHIRNLVRQAALGGTKARVIRGPGEYLTATITRKRVLTRIFRYCFQSHYRAEGVGHYKCMYIENTIFLVAPIS
ncbi:disease resistance protein UNI-like isoform X2 [Prosopis cineraria]|uniref:disease resistance protein UNI-like isoform X2 n=1 Tax=Prosopis cineraria TaxID=364024 RepID=UPI00240FAC40|nr:disease resistance protein UNI-like isoform X2 [Prosopis cineraria]